MATPNPYPKLISGMRSAAHIAWGEGYAAGTTDAAEPKRTIRMPDQRSVTDQLKDLIRLAHQNGLYDAADWVMARMSVK